MSNHNLERRICIALHIQARNDTNVHIHLHTHTLNYTSCHMHACHNNHPVASCATYSAQCKVEERPYSTTEEYLLYVIRHE